MQEFSSAETGGGAADEGGGVAGEAMGATPGETAKEFAASAEAVKKFQAQKAAVKKIRKEEKKFRKRDSKLAKILSGYIRDQKHSNIATLLARLIARNIPSIFLLAILALIDEQSREEISLRLENIPGVLKLPGSVESKALKKIEKTEKKDFKNLPPEIKNHIDIWTKNVFHVGLSYPNKIVLAVVNPDERIDDSLPQLATFIAIEFLKDNKIESDFKDIKAFMVTIFRGIIGKFYEMYKEQKKLEAAKTPKKKKGGDDDDDDDDTE